MSIYCLKELAERNYLMKYQSIFTLVIILLILITWSLDSLYGYGDGGVYFVLGEGGVHKQAPEMLTCRGSGVILRQKILKSWSSEMLLSAFSTRYQKNKCGSTLKWQMFYFLFVTWYIYSLIYPSLTYIPALVCTLNCFITNAQLV